MSQYPAVPLNLQEFWKLVYVAAVKSGIAAGAAATADTAVREYLARA